MKERKESLANREAHLLLGSEDRFGIYQLKDTEEARDIHFMGTDYLESKGMDFCVRHTLFINSFTSFISS
jgi:hypothetical protein